MRVFGGFYRHLFVVIWKIANGVESFNLFQFNTVESTSVCLTSSKLFYSTVISKYILQIHFYIIYSYQI